jgi:hypothetical protein
MNQSMYLRTLRLSTLPKKYINRYVKPATDKTTVDGIDSFIVFFINESTIIDDKKSIDVDSNTIDVIIYKP